MYINIYISIYLSRKASALNPFAWNDDDKPCGRGSYGKVQAVSFGLDWDSEQFSFIADRPFRVLC